MGWFMHGPEDYFSDIPESVNRWWDSIKGSKFLGETLIRTFGPLTIILCSNPEFMRQEYRSRHGVEMPLEAAGLTWSDGTRWEIYLPYKQVRGGIVVNPWALGHELTHVLPVANHDKVGEAEFY